MMTALSLVLLIAALALAAWSTRVSGPRLRMALPCLVLGVGSINPLIEAVFFSVMRLPEALKAILTSGATYLLLSAVVIVVLGKWRDNGRPAVAARVTPLRLLLAASCYITLYLTAGILVLPYVKDFYANKPMPSIGGLLAMQLVRGALYGLYAWPWLRLARRWPGLVLGVVFSVVGGISPLLNDNPYMPHQVRMYHLVEVGVSNFLFGLIAGWLLSAPRSEAAPAMPNAQATATVA